MVDCPVAPCSRRTIPLQSRVSFLNNSIHHRNSFYSSILVYTLKFPIESLSQPSQRSFNSTSTSPQLPTTATTTAKRRDRTHAGKGALFCASTRMPDPFTISNSTGRAIARIYNQPEPEPASKQASPTCHEPAHLQAAAGYVAVEPATAVNDANRNATASNRVRSACSGTRKPNAISRTSRHVCSSPTGPKRQCCLVSRW